MKKIESKVANTILQRPQAIKIGDKTYQVAPPSTATLIIVSELVAQMPNIKLDSEDVMSESLKIAKDCKVIGGIVSVLILGAKKPKKKKADKWFSWFKPVKDTRSELAEEILECLTPIELNALVQKLLSGMEISFFFGISTFLIGINLTKETKVEETIQSGQ